MYEYLVVTKVPESGSPEEWGNLASAAGCLYLQTGPNMESVRMLALRESLPFRVPVFVLGEVLVVLAGEHREAVGRMRCPSKWLIETERFKTIEEATERAGTLILKSVEQISAKLKEEPS